MNGKILIVDHNPDIVKSLTIVFKLSALELVAANSPAQGLVLLAEEHFDLVIHEMNFVANHTDGAQGIGLFNQIRERFPYMPIILLCQKEHLNKASALIKTGITDYFVKPFNRPWDEQKLLLCINHLIELTQLQQQQQSQNDKQAKRRQALEQKYNLCGACFNSNDMLQLLEIATQVARSDIPILIVGPEGCGKEKIAQIIQANSTVAEHPFVSANANELSEHLIQDAHGGTLFLQHIEQLTTEQQQLLLRIIRKTESEQLTEAVINSNITVRLISATNSNLTTAINHGTFNQELAHHLGIITLTIPALEQRKEDLLALCQSFLEQGYSLAPCAKHKINQYHWPGNVLQLKNTIKRAMLLCQDKHIKAANLGVEIDDSVESAIFNSPQ